MSHLEEAALEESKEHTEHQQGEIDVGEIGPMPIQRLEVRRTAHASAAFELE
jgi:hypothetical protein